MPVSVEFKDRMQAAELWKPFCKDRDEIKKNGATPRAAQAEALAKYEVLLEKAEAEKKNAQCAIKPEPEAVRAAEPPTVVSDNSGSGADSADRLDVLADVRWVYQHINEREPSGKPPSQGAFGLHQWATATSDNKKEFFRVVFPKILPSKSQSDTEDRFEDDGRQLTDTITRVQQAHDDAVLRNGAEGIQGQPDLPQAAG